MAFKSAAPNMCLTWRDKPELLKQMIHKLFIQPTKKIHLFFFLRHQEAQQKQLFKASDVYQVLWKPMQRDPKPEDTVLDF